MPVDKITRRALQIGRAHAEEVLKFRTKALRRRTVAAKKLPRPLPAERLAAVDPRLVSAMGDAATAGTLVAEGDSWFDYPFNDVLRLLEDVYAYDVESVAHKGDSVEEMAYGLGQLEKFTRRLEKLLRRNVISKAVLLSGGGNDVAGDEFGMLLNHARSSVAGLNQQVIAGVIDERVRISYITILSAVTRICEQRISRRIPILVHGYDYPVPDGRGFLGGWWVLPGPWLEPGFREKGFDDLQDRIGLAKQLIDRFNKMLKDVSGIDDFSHVKYINRYDRPLRALRPRTKLESAEESHEKSRHGRQGSPESQSRKAARTNRTIAAGSCNRQTGAGCSRRSSETREPARVHREKDARAGKEEAQEDDRALTGSLIVPAFHASIGFGETTV